MGALEQSLAIYALATAIVGAAVHSKGRLLKTIHPFEFLFLFMPWATLVLMGVAFFGSLDYFYENSGIWLYFWILQIISAGILGGFVLMPRYFVKADTIAAKMLVNTIGGLVISLTFAFTRLPLFALSSDIS